MLAIANTGEDYSFWTHTKPMGHMTVSGLLICMAAELLALLVKLVKGLARRPVDVVASLLFDWQVRCLLQGVLTSTHHAPFSTKTANSFHSKEWCANLDLRSQLRTYRTDKPAS